MSDTYQLHFLDQIPLHSVEVGPTSVLRRGEERSEKDKYVSHRHIAIHNMVSQTKEYVVKELKRIR